MDYLYCLCLYLYLLTMYVTIVYSWIVTGEKAWLAGLEAAKSMINVPDTEGWPVNRHENIWRDNKEDNHDSNALSHKHETTAYR